MMSTAVVSPPVKVYNLNGSLVPARDARLGVNDLGLLRGYAVFDFFRVVDFVPLFLNDYLARFKRSGQQLHLALPFSLDDVERHIHALIEANGLAEAGIKLLLTGGYTPDGFTPAEPNLLMIERPVTLPDASLYRAGAKLISHCYRRDIPEAKTTNYAVAISLLPRQREQGAVDVLYHDDGEVLETARSNLFIVKDGVVKTPGQNVLQGITRKRVLALARRDYKVLETRVSLHDLEDADEVFISSTIKGVMPIVAVEDKAVGQGRPGEVTQRLAKAFAAHVRDYVAKHKE